MSTITHHPVWFEASSRQDSHFMLRAEFELPQATVVSFRLCGAHWYKVWLDGVFLTDGPARFVESRPEYDVFDRQLSAGRHVLAWHVHCLGITTRLMGEWVKPFAWARVAGKSGDIPLAWSGKRLDAYTPSGRRLGCVLGWVEWCDRRRLTEAWREVDFYADNWDALMPVEVSGIGRHQTELAEMRRPVCAGNEVGRGELVNMSIIAHDPTSGFFIRELENHTLPVQGKWFRYDLGRVRLGYPVIKVRTRLGTTIQAAYAESLTFGRVHPYLKTGGGEDSCMLDHWVSAGGDETLVPLHPKGARFVEVHLIAEDPEDLDLLGFAFEERAYFSEKSEGSFCCDDALLERIWSVGRDTLVACSEDTITDNPHRERGQWLGEAEATSLELLSACFSDWRILKRSLEQAALCLSDEELLPAVYPGTREYIPSFSIQWIKSMVDYYRHTGDRSLLDALHSVGERSLEAFRDDLSPEGLKTNPKYWNFIDWGYRGANTVFLGEACDEAEVDPVLSLWYLEALRMMTVWSGLVGMDASVGTWRQRAEALEQGLRAQIGQVSASDGWEAYGYHASVLALQCGLIEESSKKDAVASIKQFILSCFPNDPAAPRLYSVTVESRQVLTPYFLHFTYPVLVANGEIDFVLDQIRSCWGWMLDQGWTTWAEMFDPRWSHCHHWAATPTWLLTRCLLGLTPSFDRGRGYFRWSFQPGGQAKASGTVPLPVLDGSEGRAVQVEWEKTLHDHYLFQVKSPEPIVISASEGSRIKIDASASFEAIHRHADNSWELNAANGCHEY